MGGAQGVSLAEWLTADEKTIASNFTKFKSNAA